MEYNAILERYYETLALEEEFDSEIFEIATEATTMTDAATNQTNTGSSTVKSDNSGTGTNVNSNANLNNTENSPANTNRIMDMIKKVIDNLMSLVKKAMLTLRNRLKKVMMTDQGYKAKLRERERSVKPLQSVKITSYQYLDEYLNTFTARLKTTVNRLLTEIERCSDPKNPVPPKDKILQLSQDKVVSGMLQEVTKKEDITEVNALFAHLQKMYRGDKRETVYRASDLPNIMKLAEEYPAIQAQLTKHLDDASRFVNRMEAHSKLLRSSGITDAQRKDFLTNNNKATKIFNAYKSILEYVFELRVEKAMNYRIIVQKFYQF